MQNIKDWYKKNKVNIFDYVKKFLNLTTTMVAGSAIVPLAGSLASGLSPVMSFAVVGASTMAVQAGTYLTMRKINPVKNLDNSILYDFYKKDQIPALSKRHVFKRIKDASKAISNEPFKIADKHIVDGVKLDLKQKLDIAEGYRIKIKPKNKNYIIGIKKDKTKPSGLYFEKIKKTNYNPIKKLRSLYKNNEISYPITMNHQTSKIPLVAESKTLYNSKGSNNKSQEREMKIKKLSKELNSKFKESSNQIKPKIKSKNIKPGKFY